MGTSTPSRRLRVVADPAPAHSIPSPRGHLITGHLREARARPLEYVLEVTRNYGDVVQLRLGPSKLIIVNHPDHIKRVLQEKSSHYGRPAFVKLLRRIVGNGLLFAEGDTWLRQRRIMQPSFHRDHVAGFSVLMAKAVNERVQRWRARAASAAPVDMTREAAELIYAIVAPALFGSDGSHTAHAAHAVHDAGALAEAITITLRWLDRRSADPVSAPLFVPTAENRQFRAAQQLFSSTVQQLIASRRESSAPRGDLLSLLLAARDADTGRGMDDQQLKDEVLTFLIAGLETTSAALQWTLLLLAQHPEALRRVRDEQRKVCGSAPPRHDQLKQMPYTRAVIDESLRLYPPVFGLTRRVLKEDSLGGYPIPKDAQLLISPYALHRHPKLWTTPDSFIPERFMAEPDPAQPRSRFSFIPFGAGPRQCIGQAFALMELQILVPTLAAAFDFSLADERGAAPSPSMTLRPTGPLLLHVTPSDPAC